MSRSNYRGFQDIRSMIDGEVAKVRERVRKATTVAKGTREIVATARSGRGEIEMTVDVSGSPIDVKVADSAFDLTADELSRTILEVARKARTAATEEYEDLVRESFGKNDETAQLMIDQAWDRANAHVDNQDEGDREAGTGGSVIWNGRRRRR